MDDSLAERVDALERAVTDGDHDLSALATEAQARDRLDSLETQYEELEARVAELEAATQALRGYVGNVRAVNEEVETQAQRALSKTESLEARLSNRNGSQPPDGGLDESAITRDRTASDGSIGQPSPEQPAGQQRRRDHDGSHSADGDKCCQACGRPHSQQNPEADTREEWSTGEIADNDPLVSEASETTGALERFRQLL
ncbi:hypothetical protein SAMN05216226_11619 [Halovenus aranensis]|jgi:TolA-binding protein|uniref:DUF7310 domain-containing protein n=1 Tax=Halovenus aranensis TaxID=890420 RepID=A0A1G8YV46_9EURY|nr:hypothetical protein [Halovenus aranensis]SDK05935.1 hypothetical protein SAMN05216226_11619 [Halovenus aranensis]